MNIDKNLFDIEYLIYSAHKTSTQTIVGTLNFNGLRARHCHNVGNINLNHDDFANYLRKYELNNAKKLNIISVFRDPVERLMSSFFQWYGTRPLREKEVNNESDTLIMKKSISELQKIFIQQYCVSPQGLEYPTSESLDGICEQLSINCSDLVFSEESAIGVNHLKACCLYLFRFDLLVQDYSGLLSNITEKKIELVERNIGCEKFYAKRYQQFKETIRVPKNTLESIYKDRKHLLNVFYKEGYQKILEAAVLKFSF